MNLTELLQRYPNCGIGFKVWENYFEKDTYYQVKFVKLLASGKSKMKGVLYSNGQVVNNKIEKIPFNATRGTWFYEPTLEYKDFLEK